MVQEAITWSPGRSARQQSLALQHSNRSAGRILNTDFHFHSFKIKVMHALKQPDYNKRLVHFYLEVCLTALKIIVTLSFFKWVFKKKLKYFFKLCFYIALGNIVVFHLRYKNKSGIFYNDTDLLPTNLNSDTVLLV